MIRIIRAPRAEQDIKDVLKYTKERWGESKALQYARLIKKAEIFIASDPTRGRPYSRKRPEVLAYPIMQLRRPARHIIFYRIRSPNTVEIIRFLHDAMDFEKHLSINLVLR